MTDQAERRDHVVNAARVLMLLKDGPRDDYYRQTKEHAWNVLRDALEALDLPAMTPPSDAP